MADVPSADPLSYPQLTTKFHEDWLPLVLSGLYDLHNRFDWQGGIQDADADIQAIDGLLDAFMYPIALYEEVQFSQGLQGCTVQEGVYNSGGGYIEGVGLGNCRVDWPVTSPVIITEVYITGEIRWTGGGTKVRCVAWDENDTLMSQGSVEFNDFALGVFNLGNLCSDYMQYLVMGNGSQTGTTKIHSVARRFVNI